VGGMGKHQDSVLCVCVYVCVCQRRITGAGLDSVILKNTLREIKEVA
jgi:hypothetical protein